MNNWFYFKGYEFTSPVSGSRHQKDLDRYTDDLNSHQKLDSHQNLEKHQRILCGLPFDQVWSLCCISNNYFLHSRHSHRRCRLPHLPRARMTKWRSVYQLHQAAWTPLLGGGTSQNFGPANSCGQASLFSTRTSCTRNQAIHWIRGGRRTLGLDWGTWSWSWENPSPSSKFWTFQSRNTSSWQALRCWPTFSGNPISRWACTPSRSCRPADSASTE